MKKIVYIYILFFLSCNPSWFGLDEEIGIYSYHDGLAFAWESFFEDDYDLAINYITSSITETEDEPYFNSAYSTLGWLYLFKSNTFIGTENQDSLLFYRESAMEQFNYVENENEAIIEYNTGCYYEHCCSDCFIADRKIGQLYTQIEEYFTDSESSQNIVDLLSELNLFINDNPEYDFMNGKPPGSNGETINLNIINVKLYLSQVYFRLGQFEDSCNELNQLTDYQKCNLDCDIVWDYSNIENLLECISFEALF